MKSKIKLKEAFVKFLSGDKIPGENHAWKCVFCGLKGKASTENWSAGKPFSYQKIVGGMTEENGVVRIRWIESCGPCGKKVAVFIKKLLKGREIV